MAFGNITAEHECNPRRIPNDDSAYTHYVVKSGVTIYKGSLVVFEDSTGLTGYVTYASNTASETFAGVAAQTVTGDGTAKIKVWRQGLFEFVKGTPAITDVGTEFYCDGGTSGHGAVRHHHRLQVRLLRRLPELDGRARRRQLLSIDEGPRAFNMQGAEALCPNPN